MPEGNKPSGGSRVGNFLRGGADRFLPGEQRGADGRLIPSQVAKGIAGRIASMVATGFGGPAAGAVTNRIAANVIDRGNPFNFGPGDGPLADIYRKISGAQQSGAPVAGVQEPIGDGRPVAPNLGLGNAGPQGVTPGQLYRDPYMGWQQFMAPQGSVGNFGNNNIRTQPVPGAWQPKSGWGRDMMAGGNAGMAGANRGFGNSHFSSGRGGAQTVDSGAAGDITAWLGGGASGGTSKTPFSRAIK